MSWRRTALAVTLLAPWLAVAGSMMLYTGSLEELPAAGIRLRPFKEMSVRPFPALAGYTYENRQTKERIEGFDLHDLWLQSQAEVLCAGDTGTLSMYTLSHNPPGPLPLINGKHVPRAVFDEAMGRQEVKWGKSTIRAWIHYATGWEIDREAESLDRRRIQHPLLAFTFKGHEDAAMAAVVRFPIRGGGDRVVALIYQAPEGTRVKNLERAMGQLVASLDPIEREADDRGPSSAMQNRRARGDAENRSPEYEAARQRVIDNIRNLGDWWYVETTNYVITSNLPRKDRRLVDEIQSDIEILRGAYEQFLAPTVPIREVSVVRVFSDRREYEDYVGPDMKWSGGAWMPPKKELVISPLELDNRKLKREVLLGVVYHEAFHQYVYYALDQHELPVWFNEGHAAFFESAEVDRRKGTIEVGENQMWAPLVERLVGSPADDLKRVLYLSHPQFYSEGREINYALSYALVYFLRKGAPVMGLDDYKDLCDLVVEDTAKGRPSAAQVAEHLKQKVNLDRLQQDFRSFWFSSKYRKKAEKLDLFEKK